MLRLSICECSREACFEFTFRYVRRQPERCRARVRSGEWLALILRYGAYILCSACVEHESTGTCLHELVPTNGSAIEWKHGRPNVAALGPRCAKESRRAHIETVSHIALDLVAINKAISWQSLCGNHIAVKRQRCMISQTNATPTHSTHAKGQRQEEPHEQTFPGSPY